MRVFARPGVVAAVLTVTAALVHPWSAAAAGRLDGTPALAAACLLAVTTLVVRAAEVGPRHRFGAGLLGIGAVLLVAALGLDGVRGREGTLVLLPGEALSHFDERGLAGRPLGLRPLGFTVGLVGAGPGQAVSLALPGRHEPALVTADRAVGFEGFRFSRPRVAPTGGALEVGLEVHREPAAGLALAALALALAGVALERGRP